MYFRNEATREQCEVYLPYIRRNARNLYWIFEEDANMLNLMIAENMIPKEDVGELVEKLSQKGLHESVTALLNYQDPSKKFHSVMDALYL